MLFSLVAPTITFYSERKYTITIADNETITMKVPLFQSRISEAALYSKNYWNYDKAQTAPQIKITMNTTMKPCRHS
jgi:hypothetical protein